MVNAHHTYEMLLLKQATCYIAGTGFCIACVVMMLE